MNTKKPSNDPGSPGSAILGNPEQTAQSTDTPAFPSCLDAGHQAPTFKTAVGFVLWEIHNSKYPDRLVPHAAAAEIARLKVSTFTTMRSRKAGPPYVRLFGTPYYDLVDLIRWIEEKMEFSRV